jgi:hypothetical protein
MSTEEHEDQGEGQDPEIKIRPGTDDNGPGMDEAEPTSSSEDSPEDLENEFRGNPSDDANDDNVAGREEQEKPKKPSQSAKDNGKTPVRWLRDGSYEVRREDGTKVVLSEDEVRRIARRRIDRATAQLRNREREFEAMEAKRSQEIEQLRREIKQSQNESRTEQPKTENAAPKLEDFESMEQFLDARDEWRDRQRAGNQPGELSNTQLEELRSLGARTAKMMGDGTKRFDDWDDVVTNNQDAPFDPVLTRFVLDITGRDGDAPAVFYALGADVETARHIRALLAAGDERGAIRALALAEARAPSAQRDEAPEDDFEFGTDDESVKPARAAKAAPAAPPRHTKAPAPISPIGQGSAPVRKNPDRESYEEYEARRRREERQRM